MIFIFLREKKNIFRLRGVPRRNAKKDFFLSWADLYMGQGIGCRPDL